MAIGRISGSVLKSNLTRNGVDLAFETNLLYLDVTNSRIGIGTSEPTTTLQVAGTVTATAFAGDGSNLTGINVDTNIQLVGDDSTGATLATGETFKIAGGTNITTAVSGDTLTVTGSKNINVNSISSDDSSAIQINDAVNVSGDITTAGTVVMDRLSLSSSQTTVPPLQLTANSLQDGVGALRIDGSQADIFLNPSTATHTTVTFAVNDDQRLAFGMDNNSDFYITRRTGGTWYDDTFVIDRDTGELRYGYDVSITGSLTADGLSYPTTDGSAGQVIKTDGSGNLSFTTISTNSVSQGDSNVTVTDSGTGSITIDADGSTIITMNATTALDASATTNAIRLPNGTTAQRPSGAVGEIRYNSSTDTIEGYTTAGGWAQLGAATATAENTDDTSTGSATAISTTQSVIDQFVTSSFDSAWYLTVTRDEINNEVSTAKHSLVHNNTSAFVATSHITESDPANSYITIDADVAGGNARLLGTGGSVVNSVSFYRIAVGDNTTAGTTGNVVTNINTDVDSASEVIDSWAHASYRGAKYYISVNNATKTELSNIEAMVVHDGTSAYITSYGNVNTGSNDLINLTATINGANVELSASGNEPNLRVTIYKILLADDESATTGDNVNVVEATTVSSAATTVDSFATTAYTGAFYVFTGYNATEGAASISEVMVVANDEAYVSTGPILSTKGTDQLTFTASLSGQTVTVQAASTSGSSTTVNGYRVHMLRGSAGASTADTVLVSTEQTITGAKTFTSPIALTVGSDPAGVADKAHIYAKDEASSAEVYVRDEAGNVTKISPHNEAGEWEYYSRNTKTGKTVRINMEEMIRDIEKLTGKTYIKND